jgi:hypothetical protein
MYVETKQLIVRSIDFWKIVTSTLVKLVDSLQMCGLGTLPMLLRIRLTYSQKRKRATRDVGTRNISSSPNDPQKAVK